jgi:hypothetical protein
MKQLRERCLRWRRPHAVNRQAISTLEGLNEVLDSFEPGATVILQLERSGRFRYLEHVLQ